MAATASEPIHLGTYPRARSSVAIPDRERSDHTDIRAAPSARVPVIGGAQDLDARSSFFSWTTLMDGVLLLAVVWTVPVAALVVGVPIALAVAFLVWIVRLIIGAF